MSLSFSQTNQLASRWEEWKTMDLQQEMPPALREEPCAAKRHQEGMAAHKAARMVTSIHGHARTWHPNTFVQNWSPLLIAAVLAPFANGAHAISAAAWIFPLCLMRFVRIQRTLIGIPIAYILLASSFAFQFWGTSPMPTIAFAGLSAIWGLVLLFSYAADKLLANRFNTIVGSLVFPCALTCAEFLLSFLPYGTWASLAYTQSMNLPLMQLVSVTGIWGLSFLIAWFASAGNSVWEKGVAGAGVTAWSCGVTIAIAFLGGGLRLVLCPVSGPTVRIASLSSSTESIDSAHLPADEYWRRAGMIDSDLLQRTEREMQAGAKIVLWAEANAPVLKTREADFVMRGASVANHYHAYLGMSLYEIYGGSGTPPRFENKLLLIGPDGQVVWSYNKIKATPGPEATYMVRGDGHLKMTNTIYGRISGMICFDGDYPGIAQQAGHMKADILLDPANDWPAIDPLHTEMASFRAVEQGVNLVRETRHGLSAAYDYEGQLLSADDYYRSDDHAMISWVPIRGAHTVYARLGDWFAWLILGAVMVLFSAGIVRPSSLKKRGHPTGEHLSPTELQIPR